MMKAYDKAFEEQNIKKWLKLKQAIQPNKGTIINVAKIIKTQ